MATNPEAGVASPPQRSVNETERSTARYLLAISRLSARDGARVSMGELRAELALSPASVTEMVSKLDDRGLVAYEKYQGVTLTERGERLATATARRVCVVTTFFDSVLDLAVDDETAFEIGVALPEDGVRRLRDFTDAACLDHCPDSATDPERCPA